MFKLDYQNMFQMFNYSLSSSKEKNIILEPLCCIFRMILLKYKEKGVKISITNNSIEYIEQSMYQGLLRSVNGDTREDLHNLYNPFLKAFEWYNNDDEESIYQYFFQKCYEGLMILNESYEKGSIIHHTLTHYCTMFEERLKHITIKKKDLEKESPLLDTLKSFWKDEELFIVFQTLQYLESCSDDCEKTIYFKTIDDIIRMKEKKVFEYVQKSSTSYN